MKRKIFSILFALVLVLTLGLVAAAPVAGMAAGVILVGPSLAEWSTEQSHSGFYSVKLQAGPVDWYDWAGLQIPYGQSLDTFIIVGTGDAAVLDVSKTNFYYHMEDGVLGQVPIMALVFKEVVEGETWKLILKDELPDTEPGSGAWKQLTTPFTTSHLWKLTGAGESADWKIGGDWGAPPLYEEFGWWQNNAASPIKGKTVDYVQISLDTEEAIVFIDDVEINDVTYDLEPATGAVGITASYLEAPPPMIGILVEPVSIDFGAVEPGKPSVKQPVVTVTNTGDIAEDFSASLANITSPDVYTEGLKIATKAVSDWEAAGVVPKDTADPILVLTVPSGTAPGTYRATLVFWAEATTTP